MKRSLRVVALFLFLSASFSTNLSAQTAGEEMNLGVQAYKQYKFEDAIQHFKKCIELAPENTNAHLYLATTYAQQYIPGQRRPTTCASLNRLSTNTRTY